jgi:hypothetical protein
MAERSIVVVPVALAAARASADGSARGLADDIGAPAHEMAGVIDHVERCRWAGSGNCDDSDQRGQLSASLTRLRTLLARVSSQSFAPSGHHDI